MTRDEILNMPAGREMDVMIEKIVFGHEPYLDALDIWRVDAGKDLERLLPKYSTNINSAFEALYKWLDENSTYTVYIDFVNTTIGRIHEIVLWGMDDQPIYDARDESLSTAICRAALLAVMEAE